MKRNKKENFGHNFWNCKDDNDCKMFHQNVCSESDLNDGKCPQHETKHNEYKKNKKNPKFQHTKKNIGQSTMFKNQNTAHQETDKTTSQHPQVNVCPPGNAGINCRHKKRCKKLGRKYDGNICTEQCFSGSEGDNCRMRKCILKSAKDIFKKKCDGPNYKNYLKGKLGANYDVNKLTRFQCNDFLEELFEIYAGKPRDSSRLKETITLESNMCKDLTTESTETDKNNCYNDILTQISKQVLKMKDSEIKEKLNCKTKSQNAQVNQDTINLKLSKNTSLKELCKKIGM